MGDKHRGQSTAAPHPVVVRVDSGRDVHPHRYVDQPGRRRPSEGAVSLQSDHRYIRPGPVRRPGGIRGNRVHTDRGAVPSPRLGAFPEQIGRERRGATGRRGGRRFRGGDSVGGEIDAVESRGGTIGPEERIEGYRRNLFGQRAPFGDGERPSRRRSGLCFERGGRPVLHRSGGDVRGVLRGARAGGRHERIGGGRSYAGDYSRDVGGGWRRDGGGRGEEGGGGGKEEVR
mmetsp:Transcript_3956/g.10927  ORF Transcript_3956/g.10927 Transcript_3956/m.10927 type:complete len:230 (+) Transcript_3956:499-1188(+)